MVQRSQDEIQRAHSAVARTEADAAALNVAWQRLKQASETKPGLIAQAEFDDAEAKDLSAKAQVEAARSELGSREQGPAPRRPTIGATPRWPIIPVSRLPSMAS